MQLKKSPSELFVRNESLKEECRRIVTNPAFKALVNAAVDRMGPFKRTGGFSDKQHIQDRIDGGKESLVLFISNLMSLPYKENIEETKDFEFIHPLDALDSTLV